jgi:hypothetical protein
MGCAEGRSPSPGVWGCPPDTISSPFLARKGVRGMVERVFQHPASVLSVNCLYTVLNLDSRSKDRKGICKTLD